MTPIPAICYGCQHLQKIDYEEPDRNGDPMKEILKCKAFPSGVPADIISNKFIHNKPYDGDNGITFLADNSDMQAFMEFVVESAGNEEENFDPVTFEITE